MHPFALTQVSLLFQVVGIYPGICQFASKSTNQQVTFCITSDIALRPGFMDPQTLGKACDEKVGATEVPLTEQETSNEENPKTSKDTAQEDEVQREDEPKSIVKRFAPWWVPHSKEHWFLTVLSLVESTNHISTLLFVTASYQRVVLEEHTSICSGGAYLKPIISADCPEDLPMPSCNLELQDLTLCEADYEYDVRLRFDQFDLGFGLSSK